MPQRLKFGLNGEPNHGSLIPGEGDIDLLYNSTHGGLVDTNHISNHYLRNDAVA